MAGSKRSETSKKRREFNEILVNAIIKSMEFGEVVLRFLELTSSLRRDDISRKPDVFAAELEGIFGDGSPAVEDA